MQKLQVGDFVDFINPSDIGVRSRQIELLDGRQWFCVQVKAGSHRRVELDLAQAGLRCFFPGLRRWVSHARTKTAKEFPVLGRYVFVEACPDTFWAVSAINGVESFVTDARGPVVIPTAIVTQFRERYLNGEWDFVRRDCSRPVYGVVKKDGKLVQAIVAWQANDPVPIGARIRVVVGQFEDMLATVTNRDGAKLTFKLKEKNVYGKLNENGVRAA